MRFTKFEFSNFRGIHKATLDLSKSPDAAVHVLIGLNESGKTTVLEAIDHFRGAYDLKSREPNSRERSAAFYQAMIPIGSRANFNGEISIRGSLEMSPDDVLRISNWLKLSFNFAETDFNSTFSIDQKIQFRDSQKTSITNYWGINFSGRKKRSPTVKQVSGEDWMKAANFVESLVPKILYFPAHVLDLPNQIRLETHQMQSDKTFTTVPNEGAFYYQVIEDVFKAVDPRVSVATHVLKRFRSAANADKQNLDALLLKAEAHLNKTVLADWEEIFGQPLRGKSFRLVLSQEEHGFCQLAVRLVDSTGQYSMNERSAGFRWFFAFILLVRYRVHRNDRVLFLFDEPAASLHPRAQSQLLKAFASLSKTHQFIFSTHSHYLVSPLWLESTYVIKNDAMDVGGHWDTDPNAASITVTPYRQFVASHPDQTFYYKPVLDALDYAPPPLGPTSDGVLVEGKTDYYLLEYFKTVVLADEGFARIYPGGGAGSLDALIGLLLGWGQEFVVLLDSDAEGDGQRARYLDKFGDVLTERVVGIADVVHSASGARAIETLLEPEDIEKLRRGFAPSTATLSKKQLHRIIQELLSTKRKIDFGKTTKENFQQLLSSLTERVGNRAGTPQAVVEPSKPKKAA